MKMTQPVVIDGTIYDHLTINLAISTKYDQNGDEDLSFALRLVPTRMDPSLGAVVDDSKAVGLYRGRLSELADGDEQAFASSLISGINNLLKSKGY
jgi:hypothetical protein